MKFSSKAKNLAHLKRLGFKKSIIQKFYKFSINEIFKDKKKIINFIYLNLKKKISIRSSFFLEDSFSSSMAGEFDGLYNIKNTKKKILQGINYLANQYKKKSKNKKVFLNSEIIFQNHLENSLLSGVVTNKCIKDGTDYYVINYDDTSSLTNTVTSGGKSGGRVINIFKQNYTGLRSEKFKSIIKAVKEIETKIGNRPFDIEFAIDMKKKVNIFQIRPISTSKNWKSINNNIFLNNLKANQNKLNKVYKKNKYFGDHMVFGLMPDWNPVEMIGYQPSELSYSLYEKLITQSSWNIARSEMGYKKVNRPLMYKFTGKPFIDARLSFFSFLPKRVKYQSSKKIVNFWSNQLKNKPYLHDKIEFEIADGSFDAFSSKKINKTYNFLTVNEKKNYIKNLKNFTEKIILNYKKNFQELNKKLIHLENFRYNLIFKYSKEKKFDFKKDLKKLVNEIIIYGIIPFSKYARYAFIGKKFLNSLKKKKIISYKTYNNLINSIETITTKYVSLEKNVYKGNKFKSKFYKYFYHLRPGTYDVRVNRYEKTLKARKIDDLNEILNYELRNIEINKKEIDKINFFLKKNKMGIDVYSLINFCVSSIKLRENSKFIFTRSLSDLLELIEKKGKFHHLNREKLSQLSINQILNINKNKLDILKKDKTLINYDLKSKLPYLIASKDDFFIASNLLTKPNFITRKVVKGRPKMINSKKNNEILKNKIIFIENADPGYDWVFSKKIKGLVTKYGGVNSHMSIRCEELNLPAVIGIGEENYEKIKSCTKVNLNCKNEQIFGV